MSPADIAVLKITLDEVKPLVSRRLEMPLSIRLDRLHLAIQAAMGWNNSHLYEIRVKDTRWGVPDPDWGDEGPLDARKARLIDVLEHLDTKTLKYVYDFGDDWEHTIKIERFTDPVPGVVYPRLTKAAGRCPLEDVGGPWGYAELLAALSDPGHERHAEFKEWIPEDFDPNVIDADWLGEQVALLAKHWSRKTTPKRPRGGRGGLSAS
ncbi:MAG: plasmid pRiA4b ORF-3 family protein [Methylacidiphilaceae bacterium]|nr:plasmid pRiA4b ORF-3 family protein [Candidatus Methylacidiphilaceae bacterium]